MKSQIQQLYAFWEYDHYPYYLGGEILRVLDSGRVHIKGYDGMQFTPIKIVTAETGRKIKAELEKLKVSHAAASKVFETEWRSRAVRALKIGKQE